MHTLHQHKRFTLAPDVAQRMSSLFPAAFDLELQVRAQAHHFDTFPVIGAWGSLTGLPQMREWEAHRDVFLAEARAEFDRVAGRIAA